MWYAALILTVLVARQGMPGAHLQVPAGPLLWNDWTDLRFVDRSGIANLNPADLGIDSLGGRHLVFGGNGGDCPSGWYWCGLYHQFSANGNDWTRPKLIPGTASASPWESPAVVADRTGRVYVAWLGDGIYICWTDDQGQTFSHPIKVSGNLPTGDDCDMVVDPYGAVHLAWLGVEWDGSGNVWENIYYAWSSPTYIGDTGAGTCRRDPVFYTGYAATSDRSGGGLDISLDVGPAQWVTIAWQDPEQALRLTQARAGDPFPPSWEPGSGGTEGTVLRDTWVVAHDDGAVSVFYDSYGPPDYKRLIHTFVALDGYTFEGPFTLPPSDFGIGYLSPRRCVQPAGHGRVEMVWVGGYFPDRSGGLIHSTSLDYGRSLVHHTLLWDYRDYPPSGDASIDLLPDTRPALICYIHRYGEAKR